ncbi:MAG TPA: dienelactone hydrolase family protein [Gemmatimonadaceae bacterium]|jgi:carboxymethylenebutenolidase|nr:dienelactone hydrolase family protein [Gemmatimonadaceae bacterium]
MSSLRIAIASCAVVVALSACRRQQPADEHMAHMSGGDLAPPAAAGMSTNQGDPKLPPSNLEAPARLAASSRHAEWVKVAWEPGSKDSLMAYIVYPSTSSAKTPVVVVVHEIFGLSTWVRGVADQVAAEGFIAIAPDLESRVRGGPSTVELSGDSARKLIANVDAAERNRGIDAVARYAMSQPSAAQRYAVIGYCWGGGTTWMHVINGGLPGFAGGVAYYGLPYMDGAVPNRDSLAKIKTPIMLLSGARDARIGAAMPSVDSAMKALGKSYVGINYPGAGHGFLRLQDDSTTHNPTWQEADLAATKDAWPRTVAFLKSNLGLH